MQDALLLARCREVYLSIFEVTASQVDMVNRFGVLLALPRLSSPTNPDLPRWVRGAKATLG